MKDELKAALIYATCTATRAEIEGMNAENQHRVICDNQISYGIEAFIDVRDELRSEVKRIVEMVKVDTDDAPFKILPEGYEIEKSEDGYRTNSIDGMFRGNCLPTRQAATASAWADCCQKLENKLNIRIRGQDEVINVLRSARNALVDRSNPTYQVMSDVLDERKRQTIVEGYTPDHDDEHKDCELAIAAASYAISAAAGDRFSAEVWWPDKFAGMFKPKSPREDLIRAAALIIAEIERLDRLAAKEADHE